MFNLFIAVMVLISPVLVVMGVIKFIKWQDKKKRTWAGIKVSKQFLNRFEKKGF